MNSILMQILSKNFFCIDHQHGRPVTWLQTKNSRYFYLPPPPTPWTRLLKKFPTPRPEGPTLSRGLPRNGGGGGVMVTALNHALRPTYQVFQHFLHFLPSSPYHRDVLRYETGSCRFRSGYRHSKVSQVSYKKTTFCHLRVVTGYVGLGIKGVGSGIKGVGSGVTAPGIRDHKPCIQDHVIFF